MSGSNDPESRKKYLLQQRAKLMQKRAQEREKQLTAYTSGSMLHKIRLAPSAMQRQRAVIGA